LNRLASFSRLILFDKRGTGLSDRIPEHALPTLEQRMDDLRAVMDAAGSERATLFGVSEGSAMCALFAATFPERTRGLVMYGGTASGDLVGDGVVRRRSSQILSAIALTRQYWGSDLGRRAAMRLMAPSVANDKSWEQWFSTFQRLAATPRATASFYRMNSYVDIRNVLTAIRVPTLILHRVDDRVARVEHARYMARAIPNARLVELHGAAHFPCAGDMDAILDEVQSFVTGKVEHQDHERLLATILFADIVGSTERAAAMGDRPWRDLLAMHYGAVRRQLSLFRGREISTEGDSILATFDGPARAIRCAKAIIGSVRDLGLTCESVSTRASAK
jgi:pimeloyl-ACP methyl ester carboxylesterase